MQRGGLRQGGIAYIGLLLIVAIIGIMLGAATDVWSTTRQRQREAELLWVGSQYRDAILAYQGSSPGQVKGYPMRLEELLQDNRSLTVKRYLRRLYPDPMTGKLDWELLKAPEGGIVGVRSRAIGVPLKQTGFRPRDMLFEGKTSYAEWVFSAAPPAPPPGTPGAPGASGAPQPGMAPAPNPAR